MEKEKEPILIQYIKNRVMNKNKNFIMLFCGPTGSGKSYSALRLGEMLDPTFDISRCCFTAKSFMKVINELTDDDKKISGKVLLWDEFGVEHNAKEFMTISNRVINYFFQTSRHLNLIVLMSVPLLSFIDSSTRKLCHGVAEMMSINTQKKTASVKIKMIQTNVLSGKEYSKYLRFRKGGKQYKSSKVNFNLPSTKLVKDYELKKREFTKLLNIEIMDKLNKVKPVKEKTETQTDYLRVYNKFNGNVKKVAEFLDTSERNVYACVRRAKMKEMNILNPETRI